MRASNRYSVPCAHASARLTLKTFAARSLNPRVHVNKIVALAEIYGAAKVALALDAAAACHAYASEYIENILQQRERHTPQPGPLHLTRHTDLLEVTTGQRVDNPSTDEWLNGWVEDKKGSRSGGTYLRYEGVVKQFIKFLPNAKRTAPLSAFTVSDLRNFREFLLSGGRSPTMVNMADRIRQTPLTVARKLGYITHNPAEALDSLTAHVEKRGVLTLGQVGALVRAVEGD